MHTKEKAVVCGFLRGEKMYFCSFCFEKRISRRKELYLAGVISLLKNVSSLRFCPLPNLRPKNVVNIY